MGSMHKAAPAWVPTVEPLRLQQRLMPVAVPHAR
jgi:hypothetical protein